MSTIDKIDQLVEVAIKLGYTVRYDYFGGTGGGVCEFNGSKVLFVDLAMTSAEQLEHIRDSLADDPLLYTIEIPDLLRVEFGLSPRAA